MTFQMHEEDRILYLSGVEVAKPFWEKITDGHRRTSLPFQFLAREVNANTMATLFRLRGKTGGYVGLFNEPGVGHEP